MRLFKILLSISLIFLFFSLYGQEKVVKTYSGSGGKTTRPFTVNDEWEIQWDAEGAFFQLYLYNENGNMIGVPANQQGSGTGNSYKAEGGNYHLKVNATGEWTIKIVQLNSSNQSNNQTVKDDKSYIKQFTGSGGQTTRPFTVSSGWEIQWDAEGAFFQLYLYDENGNMIGVPANQQGGGTGSSYKAEGGEFYLKVNATKDWKIKIVNVE